MGGLQGGNNSFKLGAQLECSERLIVSTGNILSATCVAQEGMFRPNARIVEAGANRVGVEYLPVIGLQQVGAVAMQDAGAAAIQGRRVLTGFDTVARRLDANQAHTLVIDEGMEQADRIRPAANTGHHRVRQAAFALQYLRAGLNADHALKVADHFRIGVRTRRRADAIECVVDIRHPVAQGLVHRILQRACAGRNRHDLGAEQAHAEHVRLLALNIRLAHENDALQAETRADGCRRHPVLASPGFGDDACLAHAHGQQHLTKAVIDLVRAGMVQLVAFEIDFRAAKVLGHALGEIKRRRTADIMRPHVVHLRLEGRVQLRRAIFLFQAQDQRHQRFGDIAPTKFTEATIGIRPLFPGVTQVHVLSLQFRFPSRPCGALRAVSPRG